MAGVVKPVALAGVTVVALVLVAGVPLVTYSTSFSASSASPATISGRATIFYYLTGLGVGPYQPLTLVRQGNSSALVHFVHQRIAYWEGPFPGATEVDPSGVVDIVSASIAQQAFGLLNFSVVVTNVGTTPVANLSVTFHYPSYGANETVGTVPRLISPVARCARILQPSVKCLASLTLPQSPSLLTDEDYPMLVEASSPGSFGYVGPFVFAYTSEVKYTGAGLGNQWVTSFIADVDRVRGGSGFTDNRTLDEFAAFRYDSLRAEFQISDFNFTRDYSRFFGASGPNILEEILYPGSSSPSAFLTYLQKHAPGHYAGLLDSVYRQYGFFFGTGPAVEVGPECSTNEVPGPNINITQWVISHGCSYVIADEIWFIIILGP